MKKLYIIKTGSTFAATKKQFGDFEDWIAASLENVKSEISVIDVEHGEALPAAHECLGVVVTGSHAMITDDLPWSVKTEKWIPSLIENGIPFFGICYGHQLLARAGGGSAGFHPHGREIGTVKIQILPEGKDDVLFGALPRFIPAHAVHAQTVLRLPPGAVRLALNSHESNHAFRLGDCAWGVQFHPEYNVDIMRSYIEEQKDELESAGFDVSELINGVVQTSDAAGILENFVRFVEARK